MRSAVDLDEGFRMMSRIVGCLTIAVSVGDRVGLYSSNGRDGRHTLLPPA